MGKEKKIINSFYLEIIRIKHERTIYLRKIAKEKGIIAPILEDLKSSSGKPFLEKAQESREMYRKAVVLKPIEARHRFPSLNISETAFFCHSIYLLQNDEDSCGWVKGDPIKEKYNEIGLLSGSAGVRYYCPICGKLVGEERSVFS